MGTKKPFLAAGHVRTWLCVNGVVIAVAIVLLLVFASLILLWMHPRELAQAAFTSILASIAALAIAAIASIAALRRVESTHAAGVAHLDATTQTAAAEVGNVRQAAERDLAALRDNAQASINAARDEVKSKSESAAFFERLRFTQMLLDGRDIREPAEWLDNLFLNNGGDIRKIRDDLKRDLVFGNLDATRNALAIYNAIAAIAEYFYSNLVVPEIILSRMAVRAQLAGYYFGPAFSALGMINRTASKNVQRLLEDTKAYTRKNEPWLEQLVPEFYQESEAQSGAAFPVVTTGEVDKMAQFKQSMGGKGYKG